jgi:two-component system sensor histidine kinase/response regulator
MLETVDHFRSFADITDNRDLIIQVAANYTIVRLNSTAEQVLGCATHEVRGKDILVLCGERGWPLPFFSESNEGHGFQANQSTAFHWRSFALPDANNRLSGFMIIGHITHNNLHSGTSNISLNNIITNIPYFVYWKDAQLRYAGCNENFAKLLGIKSASDIVGKVDEDIAGKSELLTYFKKDKRVLTGVALMDEEIEIIAEDGQQQSIRASKVPLRDTNQKIIGMMGIHTDITAQKRVEIALTAAKEAAESANKYKTEFIANISHDLRTSLNVVTGMSKLLRERVREDESLTLISGIIEAAHNLTQQIDEVLDYSKIEAGKVSLQQVPFDLQKLLEEVIDLHSFEAHVKGVHLLHDYQADVPTQVIGDPVATKRIFGNLLSNALKFTAQGHLLLKVNCPKRSADTGWFEFTVEDTGIGIAKEKLSSIFNRFERVDSVQNSRFEGTGLGLSIVSWLIKRLGGGVDVTSELGRGTLFKVTLPFQCGVPMKQDGPALRVQPGLFSILLIDDYFPRAQVTANLLGAENVTIVDSAHAVSRLLQGAQQSAPFAVLLINEDITACPLPLLLAGMKAHPEFSHTAVALLICESYRLDQSMMALAKPFAQIQKPIKPSKINQQVADLVKEHAKQREGNVPDQAINYDGRGKLLLVEDEPLSQKYCQLLLQGRGYQLDIASNGKIALEFIAKQRYQSILMDVGLPDASGIDVARVIRSSDNPNRNVPIIALTAHLDQSKQQACLDAGMTAFLNKPVSPNTLCELLTKVAA